jgi:hypothetical protein
MVAALLIIVALSKPSIFWSLKLAREGFQEALTYWTVAAALAAFRKDRPMVYLVLGLVVAVNFLNRPNALPIVPVIALLLVGIHIWNRRSADDDPHTRRFSLGHKLGAFLLGILALWGPWIARSIAIYGEPVLLSTQGPYAVLWELGEIRVRLRDGREIVTHVNRLQAEAGQFPNDLAASKYANEIAQAWISEHRSELPSLMFARIGGSIGNRDVHLTKVPRDVIFGPPWDSFLLDKGRATTYAGALGLLVLPGLYGWRLLILPAAALIPWLTAAALIGYARWLEPAIPLILFGCIAWIMVGARILARTRMAPVNSVS